jgi:hypothetical protein
MVAREFYSGREIRSWRDDLLKRTAAPFDTGPDSLFVAYFASAELGCFGQLGWRLPSNVLDLYAEWRVLTNGLSNVFGNGLLGVLAAYGLAHIGTAEKESMRALILEHTDWSSSEREEILQYCASDVEALTALLPKMMPVIDLPRALLRGRYMAVVSRIESNGVPI